MDQLGDKLKDLSTDLRQYMETRLELFVIDISEHVTKWVSLSIQKWLGILLLASGVQLAMIALGIYLGELLDSYSLGFLIVSLPLLLLGLIFSFTGMEGLAKGIQKKFMAGVIQSMEDELKKDREQKLLPKSSSKKAEADGE
jgi:uncharacterized membrane protein YqjE